MGQRAAHETFLGIMAAFIDRKQWTQAELARAVEVSTEAVRKQLLALQADGWPLTEKKEHPHVVWRLPAEFFPGVLSFKVDEVPDLLRVIARSPRSPSRNRLLKVVERRLPLKHRGVAFEPAVRAPEITESDSEWIDLLEDCAARKLSVRMNYNTASRRANATRHVSVHSVKHGRFPRFIATCHKSDTLKWFRVAGITSARPDPGESFRARTLEQIASFEAESLDGFHDEGPAIECIFFVRQPEAAWVERNLLDGMKAEEESDGIRVSVKTPAVDHVARFVVSLGRAAKATTPELVARIRELAEGALETATADSGRARRAAGS